MPRSVSSAPFGMPVVPDVNSTSAGLLLIARGTNAGPAVSIATSRTSTGFAVAFTCASSLCNVSRKWALLNARGTLFTVQKALPLMAAGGSIVLNSSMVSVKGMPGFTVYAATKAALRSFARTWAVDLKGRNIRVNVVSPGTVVTPAVA